MTDQERAQFFKAAVEHRKKNTASPEAAREFFMRIGVLTKKGNLRKPYKHLFQILAQHKSLINHS